VIAPDVAAATGQHHRSGRRDAANAAPLSAHHRADDAIGTAAVAPVPTAAGIGRRPGASAFVPAAASRHVPPSDQRSPSRRARRASARAAQPARPASQTRSAIPAPGRSRRRSEREPGARRLGHDCASARDLGQARREIGSAPRRPSAATMPNASKRARTTAPSQAGSRSVVFVVGRPVRTTRPGRPRREVGRARCRPTRRGTLAAAGSGARGPLLRAAGLDERADRLPGRPASAPIRRRSRRGGGSRRRPARAAPGQDERQAAVAAGRSPSRRSACRRTRRAGHPLRGHADARPPPGRRRA
jgi:hypothetical protein